MSKEQPLSANSIKLSNHILRAIEDGINSGLINLVGRGIDDAQAILIATVVHNKLVNLPAQTTIKINFFDNNITNEGAKVVAQWYQLCFDFYKFHGFGTTVSSQIFLGKNKLITEEFKNNYSNPMNKVRINDLSTGENLKDSRELFKKFNSNKTEAINTENKSPDTSLYLDSYYNQTGVTKKVLTAKPIPRETGEPIMTSITGNTLESDETV